MKTWKKLNEEAKKHNQTQLKTTGRDEQNVDNQAKNMKNAALKVSA